MNIFLIAFIVLALIGGNSKHKGRGRIYTRMAPASSPPTERKLSPQNVDNK